MADFLAGQTLTPLHFTPTVTDEEVDAYSFTTTTFDVTFTSGTYNDCGVAFTAPASGRVLVNYNAQGSNSTSVATSISPVVRQGATVGAGALVSAASDDDCITHQGTVEHRRGASRLVTGLTPGSSYNVRLEHRVSSGTGTVRRRSVIVSPAT
jgi:hypothetical protein